MANQSTEGASHAEGTCMCILGIVGTDMQANYEIVRQRRTIEELEMFWEIFELALSIPNAPACVFMVLVIGDFGISTLYFETSM